MRYIYCAVSFGFRNSGVIRVTNRDAQIPKQQAERNS
jgi:hypothetical protein